MVLHMYVRMSWLVLYTYTMTAISWIISICHATYVLAYMCTYVHTYTYSMQL